MGSTSVCCPTCKAAGMSSTLDPVGVEKGKLNFEFFTNVGSKFCRTEEPRKQRGSYPFRSVKLHDFAGLFT